MVGVDKEKFETLTEKEKKYFRMMNGKSGVLFLTAEPGVAKSAISRSIAKKMDMQYFDIRLSMVDEIDVGLFPYRKEVEIDVDLNDGSEETTKKLISVMSYAIPEWAYEANQKPTLIHFEELNRAPLAVRNAALQILLERSIGTSFKFNDNVYMMSSGNLGEADGTDVEEFDRALNNRLIHYKHTLSIDDWINNFGIENIHPVIVDFLKTYEEHFLHSLDGQHSATDEAYATPRSWTFLSDYIVTNYGMESSINEWINDIRELGASYVGPGANSRFTRFLDESLRFGINDLINRYDEIIDKIKTLSRDKKSELLNALKQKRITEFTEEQKENIKKFLLTVSKDEAVAYILKILDDDYQYMEVNDSENSVAEEFLADKRFESFYEAIVEHIPDPDSDLS